jgi:hypothetical protein
MTCGEGKDRVERSARSRASAKRTVGGIGEAVEVDGMLRDRGGGVLQAKRLRLTVCSRAGGGSMLWVKRSRAKRSSGVEGEAVEAMACSGRWQCRGAKACEW